MEKLVGRGDERRKVGKEEEILLELERNREMDGNRRLLKKGEIVERVEEVGKVRELRRPRADTLV